MAHLKFSFTCGWRFLRIWETFSSIDFKIAVSQVADVLEILGISGSTSCLSLSVCRWLQISGLHRLKSFAVTALKDFCPHQKSVAS